MAIDFNAEAERQRAAAAAAAKLQAARDRLLPLSEQTPLAANRPLTPAAATPALFTGMLSPQATFERIREKSGQAFVMNAPFHSFFRAWPLLGRHSVIAVVREAYLLINGREPTLDECDNYLRGAVESRLNSGELRYLVAVNAGLASPRDTLNKRQLGLKILGTLARRTLGVRAVPYKFTAAELAFDSFMLDTMRVATSFMIETGAPSSWPRA